MYRGIGLALAGLAIFLLPGAARPADAPRAGKIVYARQEGDRVLLHVMNADGTADAVVPGQTASFNLLPAWSPDGRRIAFMGGGKQEGGHIYLTNADGTGASQPNTPSPMAGLPAWSPDGKQLAFCSGKEAPFVYIADAEGNGARPLVPAGARGVFPFWSRDGKAVGYTRLNAGEEKGEIVLAKLDGSGEAVLTQTGKLTVAGANALSPDGKRLLYIAVDIGGRSGTLRVLDLASKIENTIMELKLDYVGEFFLAPAPAWSPDGKGALLPLVTEKGRGLFLVSEDGKTRTRLTPEGVDCLQAAWHAGR
jgi:TolB protein